MRLILECVPKNDNITEKVSVMKHTMLPIAAALIAAFSLAAADSKDLGPNLPDPDKPVEIRVTSGDANKEISAKVGEIIVIELDSNPTTGYSWAERPGRSDSVLEPQGNEYVSRDREMGVGMLGGPGKTLFRYLVKAPGKTEIVFGFSRPWERDTPPAQLFNVKINASEAAKTESAKTDTAKTETAKSEAAKTVEVSRDDNGKTVTVRPGDTVRIKLRSNRTTGYSWAMTGKLDEKVLKSEGNEYKVDEHPAGMVGVGGSDVWTFAALAAGKTEIALGYARPWEKDKEPAQAFKLTVVVDGAAASADNAKSAPAVPKEVDLNDGDNGKTVKVAVDGMIVLSLDSNATTGFSWTGTDKVDKDILKLERNDYMQNPNPGGMVGVGGKTVLLYRALKPGKAKIDLTYMQPWEPDSQYNTNYTVTIEVVDKP